MAFLSILFSLILCHSIRADYVRNVPYEQYYLPSNISRQYFVNECQVNEWIGMCAVGLFGYQYVTTITCPNNAQYHMEGINNFGELNMINIAGKQVSFSVNNSGAISHNKLHTIGDYVWFSQGLILNITITGSVYLFGGNTTLTPVENADNVKAAQHVYNTMPFRVYRILDGELVHDPHINNGNAYTFDVVYSTQTLIDPPYIFVINCDNNTFVEDHFHPWNALYLPVTAGNLYFLKNNRTLGKAVTGYPRWVSATLRYNEQFETVEYKSESVDQLIGALGIDQSRCQNPLLFAVTNFDVNSSIGAPNFDDPVSDTMEITPTRLLSIVVAH